MRIQSILRKIMKVLNVAEKNDAAKNLAAIMSNGTSRMRNGESQYNKIYEFNLQLFGKSCQMVMTSVSGHLLALEFVQQYKGWHSCSAEELFSAEVVKGCPENYEKIKRTLEREVRSCDKLIIWTDCDREGENIGFEIINVCKAVKPNLDIYRAIFSEITQPSVRRALQGLKRPNKNISDAVDARIELDLRIGASFTRFQTLRLQKVFPQQLANNLISYGSCQFPTLGFVVERFKQRESFVSEPFWKINVKHMHNDREVEFTWERVRLFDYDSCLAFYNLILANPIANVRDVKTKPKSKWRPVALDTIELEKSASRKLKINAKETMKIAEKLYTAGYISYPRTETNIFPKDFDLTSLIEKQTGDQNWGQFAAGILESGGPTPRNGSKSDQAHPPIHPTKYTNSLTGTEKSVYDFIVRHFLACCQKDAKGFETTISIEINNEKFSTSGLMITERNYLDIYVYEKWSDKEIPIYRQGDQFTPNSIDLKEGITEAPQLLTEADLISLMEKHGIGTDATHAEHIETIKEREYVHFLNNRFTPGEIGLGLVEGYDSMGYEMSKPNLRAALEEDLKAISEGRKTKDEVLRCQIEAYKNVFVDACQNVEKLDLAMSKYFGPCAQGVEASVRSFGEIILDCSCNASMVLKKKADKNEFYLSCRTFPNCKKSIWFPSCIIEASATDEYCTTCSPKKVKKIKFKLDRKQVPATIPTSFTTCILCDHFFRETLNINISTLHNTHSNAAVTTTINNRNNSNHNLSGTNQNLLANETVSMRSYHTMPASDPISGRPTHFSNHKQEIRNSRNQDDPNNTRDDNEQKVCYCSMPAALLTVRKEGANQGKQFYGCGNNKSCDFFMWKDGNTGNGNSVLDGRGGGGSVHDNNCERENGPVRAKNQAIRSPFNTDRNASNFSNRAASSQALSDGSTLLCTCGLPSILLTVRKEGENQGKQFHKCSTGACKFFEWFDASNAENLIEKTTQKKSTQSSNEPFEIKKRKCGICHQEGHNKKSCPNNN